MAGQDGAVHSWKFCVPGNLGRPVVTAAGVRALLRRQAVMGESAGNSVAGRLRAQHRWSFRGRPWSVAGCDDSGLLDYQHGMRTGATGRCSIPAGTLNGGVDDGQPGMYMAGRGRAVAEGGLLW